MGWPVIRGASSELAGWNASPNTPVDGGHDDGPAEPREDLGTHSTRSVGMCSVSGSQANNLHYSTLPPSHPPPLFGQEPCEYQDVHEGEIGTSLLGGTSNPPPLSQVSPPHAFDTFVYHDGLPGNNANHDHDYGWTGFGYDHQYTAQLSSTSRADVPPIPPAQNSSKVGVFRLEGQFSSTEQNRDQDLYDGRWSEFSGSAEVYPPYPEATGYHPHPYYARVARVISYKTDARENAGSSLSRPTGVVWNDGAMQAPAESPPQYPNKRKRATTLDGTREGKRARHEKPQDHDIGEQTLVAPVAYLPTRPDLRLMKQTTYRCGNEQKDWKPLPTIDFTVRGKEGICLTDAANLHFSDLDGRDDLMFRDTGIGNSVSCRIEFVGHRTRGIKLGQIVTKNHKKERGPITKQKLAHDVTKRIKSYLQKGGAPFRVRSGDMFLVRLHNVSRASWQPEVWYRDPPSSPSTGS